MMDDSDHGSVSGFTKLRRFIQQRSQKVLDDVTPYVLPRWVFAALLVIIFCARVFILQGWYIIAYAVGIYHLNLFISFISPKIDPALDFEDDSGPSLPTRANEEFRPFIRRLPEFKFWYSVCKSTAISILCTFFTFFNIPVFWPILVLYFITLFGITMKRQIKHMIRYRYVPYTYGKPKYQGHEDPAKVAANPDSTRQSETEDVKKKLLTETVSNPILPLLTPSNVI